MEVLYKKNPKLPTTSMRGDYQGRSNNIFFLKQTKTFPPSARILGYHIIWTLLDKRGIKGGIHSPRTKTPGGKVAESSAHAARATKLLAEQILFDPRTAPSITAKRFPPAACEGAGTIWTHLEKRDICCRTALLDNGRTLETQALRTSTVLHFKVWYWQRQKRQTTASKSLSEKIIAVTSQ